MADFTTYEQMAKEVAEKALDEFLYHGKSIREWIKIITEKEPCEDCISRQAVLDLMQSLTRWCVRSEDGKFNNVGLLYDDVMFGVDRLPSVNPQEPMIDQCQKEIHHLHKYITKLETQIVDQEPKQGHCKDCKWWKDSDGKYRRGVGAESICPINSMIVHDGDGYCYLFSKNE